MFTGLVEEIGTVTSMQIKRGARCFTIAASEVLSDLQVDHSVAVNGVCLTAVQVSSSSFEVVAVEETLAKTTLGALQKGSPVNLERALKAADRMGGHFVQGHVDGVATVVSVVEQSDSVLLTVRLPSEKLKYVISEGSICIDGVSLTVARLAGAQITAALIPHTLQNTTLGNLIAGDRVNVEVDLIGKYVENILTAPENREVTERWMRQIGFRSQSGNQS